MQDYRKLNVWKSSFEFVSMLYRITQRFPSDEAYGLTLQLRRASVSIASNIAEGAGRNSSADFARFLDIAIGSAFEVECQLLISKEIGFTNEQEIDNLLSEIDKIKKMLFVLIQKVRNSSKT